jgi:uncharacterized small protein (DUF1192 family)
LRGYEGKCDELENKIVLLTTEIDRLNEVVRAKLREIEEWRNRYNSIEITAQKYKSYEGKMIELENRVALMSNEIERLNQLLKQRMNELDEWKSRYSNIESSLISSESRCKELENRIVMLSTEIDRL